MRQTLKEKPQVWRSLGDEEKERGGVGERERRGGRDEDRREEGEGGEGGG